MTKRSDPSFGVALQRLRAAMHLSQGELGARIGVSRRTLTRWETQNELPPLGQQKHLATITADGPAVEHAALLDALEVDDEFKALVARRNTADPAPGALDAALLAMAEQLNMSPGPIRSALVAFLARMQEGGLSAESARSLLAKGGPRTTGSARKTG